jgi:hypothetical protein
MPPGIYPPACICFIMLSMPCLFLNPYLAYPCHQASVLQPASVSSCSQCPACPLALPCIPMPPGICPPSYICFIMLSMSCLFLNPYLAYPCHQASVLPPTSGSSCSQCLACSLNLTLHTHATWHLSSSLHLFHHALNALPVP